MMEDERASNTSAETETLTEKTSRGPPVGGCKIDNQTVGCQLFLNCVTRQRGNWEIAFTVNRHTTLRPGSAARVKRGGTVNENVNYVVGVLTVRSKGVERAPIHLRPGETIRVGRVETNDLVLPDALGSRFHAVFNASPSGLVLSDLSSLNGTFVNGRRISSTVGLRPGDVVTIGNMEITVHAGTRESDLDEDAERTTVPMESTLVAQMKGVVVTVLLADVCSYTRYSQELAANDVTSMLQLWFSRVSETVEEFGGEIDKYIGDCVMALWCGSPHGDRRHATDAARAAMAIRERTDALSASGAWIYHASNPWRCRLSMNSGEALMGTLGGTRTRDFTVLGDTVNVAFRLNDLAGTIDQDIVISAETARLIEDAFVVKLLGRMPVEGRSGTVEIYSLVEGK
jgi:adenylate cyclase